MGPQPTVTNVLFDAFLRCKMKAHLLAVGAEETDTYIPRRQQGWASPLGVEGCDQNIMLPRA